MKMIQIEMREEDLEKLHDIPHTVVGRFNAANSAEAGALYKLRNQAIKDASAAYKKAMAEVEKIDVQLHKLNNDER